MQRALDALADELALVQRAAAMCAAVSKRADLPVHAGEDDRLPVDLGAAQLPLGQGGVVEDLGPILWARLQRRLVDPDRLGVGEVSAEVSANRKRPHAGEPEGEP